VASGGLERIGKGRVNVGNGKQLSGYGDRFTPLGRRV